ncbi:MAG: type II secretion system GspH family protein [Phycisphaerales bacterium]|nr:type II secretion system GspH family protein [Phycisphaerales bacterium]
MRIRDETQVRGGFSLVELMVVIAIIGILTAIVVVSLTRSQDAAQSANCLANQRHIVRAWMAYGADNNGEFPGPDTNRNPDVDWMHSFGANIGPGNSELIGAITDGSMYQYIGDALLYRSPQDHTDHIRTYSINAFLSSGEGSPDWGGPPVDLVSSIARIRNPSQMIVVLPENDHRGHNINGWGMNINGSGVWIDKLATFNPGRINLCYLDGHSAQHVWTGVSPYVNYDLEYAFNLPQTNVYFPGADYEWIRQHIFDPFMFDEVYE